MNLLAFVLQLDTTVASLPAEVAPSVVRAAEALATALAHLAAAGAEVARAAEASAAAATASPGRAPTPVAWLVVGFLGQMLFASRFWIQWIASERARRSIVPTAFWYLSLAGSSLLLAYAIHRLDPVFILGQSTGFAIYLRNLWLIRRATRAEPRTAAA